MEPQTIVIDNGSEFCRMGVAGYEGPFSTFPSVVGRNLFKNLINGCEERESYFGDWAMSQINRLNLASPIVRGTIVNWDDMTKIWHHGFSSEIRRDQSNKPCLMSQPFQTPRAQRQKITEIMFEHFKVSQFYLQKSQKLAMYEKGITTGFFVDCGHGLTQFCPFIDGQYFPYAVQVSEFGGLDLNSYLIKLLKQVTIKLHQSQSFKFRDVKKNHCYVALDYEAELEKPKESIYELPDKSKVSLKDQRFRCPEILFRPNIIGKKVAGVHESIFNSISNCDKFVSEKLYQNICLVGGSTLFPGFSERLKKQLNALLSDKVTVNILKGYQKNAENSNWIGGSIEASLSSFSVMYITKKQFEQSGSKIVHKKC